MNKTLFLSVLGALTVSCSSVKESTSQLYLSQGGVRGRQYYYTDKFGSKMPFHKFYQEGRQFSNHLAAVKTNGKWGFIDEKGETAIPFRYDWVSSFGEYGFDENIAMAKTEVDKDRMPIMVFCPTTLINDKGENVSQQYCFISPIERKLAVVNNGTQANAKQVKPLGELVYTADGAWGCIDKHGKEVVKCQYELMYPFFATFTFVRKNGRWGCINEKGKEIIPCKYDGGLFKSPIGELIDTSADADENNKPSINAEEGIIYMYLGNKIAKFTPQGKQIK